MTPKQLTPKQYLNQGYRLRDKIEMYNIELAKLRMTMDGMKSIQLEQDKISSGRVESQVENTVIKITVLMEKIQKEIDHSIDLQAEIRDEIKAQPYLTETQKMILHYRYVNFFRWDQICKEIHLESSQTYELHRQALDHFMVPPKVRSKSE